MSLFNKLVVTSLPFIPKAVVGQVSRRYIAGVKLEDAVRTVHGLNKRGLLATLDLLGEDITEHREALQTRDSLLNVLRTIRSERLESNLSLKPTQLGLRISLAQCYQNIRALVEEARVQGNFVRIDMEDSSTTEQTLEVYRRLRGDGFDNVGVVLQSALKRSEADVRALAGLKANVRLCKGIYLEPSAVAYQHREEVRRSFVALLRLLLDQGMYVGIATHDEVLVDEAYRLLLEHGAPRERYEFQMLLGVREELRNSIASAGHRLRVYVPYGEQWYAYSTRRLKENPRIAGYVVKAMLGMN